MRNKTSCNPYFYILALNRHIQISKFLNQIYILISHWLQLVQYIYIPLPIDTVFIDLGL